MDDYFDSYEQYDQAAIELKETLIQSVKKEVTDKINNLTKENAELRSKQANLSQLERAAELKAAELQRTISTAERDVRFRKAKDLFREISVTKYIISYEHYSLPKCNICDEKRQIPFIYPSGKEGFETCYVCGGQRTRDIVTEAIGTSVDIRNGELMIWYTPYRKWESDDEYGSMDGNIKTKYINQPFADIDRYRIIFEDKDKAQEYVDYLNEIRLQK